MKFELSLPNKNALRKVEYVQKQGTQTFKKGREVTYTKIENSKEYDKIKNCGKWENIEKGKSSEYKIERCKIENGNNSIYYYKVIKTEKSNIGRYTEEMIYKKFVN